MTGTHILLYQFSRKRKGGVVDGVASDVVVGVAFYDVDGVVAHWRC